MKKILSILGIGAIMASCSLTTPVTATNNTIGSKVGTSESTCLFAVPVSAIGPNATLSSGIVLNSKYGIVDAAKNGGISKISTVDLKVQNFYLFTKQTIIVTGE